MYHRRHTKIRNTLPYRALTDGAYPIFDQPSETPPFIDTAYLSMFVAFSQYSEYSREYMPLFASAEDRVFHILMLPVITKDAIDLRRYTVYDRTPVWRADSGLLCFGLICPAAVCHQRINIRNMRVHETVYVASVYAQHYDMLDLLAI